MNLTTRLTILLVLGALSSLGGCSKEKAPAPPEKRSYATQDYTNVTTSKPASAIQFTDITLKAGIQFKHVTGAFGRKWMPETMGSGCGLLDYDGDGHLDILLVNGCDWPGHDGTAGGSRPTQALYRNKGDATFDDVTAAAGLDRTMYGMGCAFADYDSDGDTDIYVTAVGPNVLWRNDAGRFTDVTAEAGVDGNIPGESAPAWSTSAAWLDADRDGRPDLFVCNYVKWSPETDLFTTLDGKHKSYATPQQYQGDFCRLYRNLDGSRFEDVTEKSGLHVRGKALGVAVADFNDDGWMDLAVSNDTEPNFLFMNRGDGTFAETGIAAGIGKDEEGRARAGMGIDAAELAGDGRAAIVIGNFSREPLSLYTQLQATSIPSDMSAKSDVGRESPGRPTRSPFLPLFFQDQAGRARLTRPTLLPLTFGTLFGDFDNDGGLDLAIANGHIEPEINAVQQDVTFAQRPQLFRNDGAGAFLDVSDQAGEPFARPIVARGLAAGDIDSDGDLDLLITTNGGGPLLLRNELSAESSRSVRIRLRGAGRNTAALGARLRATCGPLVQRRLVRTGSSYLSQSDTVVTFGTGTHGKIDKLEVRWPVGRTDTFTDLRPGRLLVVHEESRKIDAADR